jgi:hypothetical protein
MRVKNTECSKPLGNAALGANPQIQSNALQRTGSYAGSLRRHGPGTDHRNPKLEELGRLPDAEGDPDRDESADRLNHERTRAFRASRARRDPAPAPRL